MYKVLTMQHKLAESTASNNSLQILFGSRHDKASVNNINPTQNN